MTELLKPDLCIIGGGAAGVAAAGAAARRGLAAVLIERAEFGGAHLNCGGISLHALGAAAARVGNLAGSERFGIAAQRPKVDFFALRDHLHHAIAGAAADFRPERLGGMGVRVISGAAAFSAADTVATEDFTVKAGALLLATGAAPVVPSVPGLVETPHLTFDNVFELTTAPRHLIVLGADRYALALAQAHLRLGAEVTVLAPAALLPQEDGECVGFLRTALRADGLVLREHAEVRSVQRQRGRIRVSVAGEEIEGSHLLVAGPRRPAVDGLGLERAKVALNGDAAAVDARFRTGNRRVYAVGDVIGAEGSASARSQAEAAVAAIAGEAAPPLVEVAVVPTDPALARVGLSEADAKARHGRVGVLRRPLVENDLAQAQASPPGLVKAVLTMTGQVLGAAIVAPNAQELIAPWALAIREGLGIEAMGRLSLPYPSYGAASVDLARDQPGAGLTPSRLRRIMGRLRQA